MGRQQLAAQLCEDSSFGTLPVSAGIITIVKLPGSKSVSNAIRFLMDNWNV